jgi:prepilin-type processing-associated H-X9-DG protein
MLEVAASSQAACGTDMATFNEKNSIVGSAVASGNNIYTQWYGLTVTNGLPLPNIVENGDQFKTGIIGGYYQTQPCVIGTNEQSCSTNVGRHSGGACYVLLDGHVKWVNPQYVRDNCIQLNGSNWCGSATGSYPGGSIYMNPDDLAQTL